jgi:amidase
MAFNTLTTTASDLRLLLEKDELSSVKIVETYLSQIERHNKARLKLQALISVAPRQLAIERAQLLDDERKAGKTRSPLHGIPIVLKDAIVTHASLGMPTTAGSKAFLSAKANHNAVVVDKLLDAGLIILAKANLTEFCGLVGPTMMPGYSSAGGQTISAYVRGGIEKDETIAGHSGPGGSSTGSAVAVSAGFAPLAIGTETSGSVIMPASRAGLYAMKLTVGSSPCEGVFRICKTFDSLGPMAMTAEDLELLVDIILERKGPESEHLKKAVPVQKGLKVGFVDPRIWNLDESMIRPIEGAPEQMVIHSSKIFSLDLLTVSRSSHMRASWSVSGL